MAILDKWSRYLERKKRQREKDAALVELIERMVQDSDPAIRKVAGYRRQLQKPVENALGYIEGVGAFFDNCCKNAHWYYPFAGITNR